MYLRRVVLALLVLGAVGRIEPALADGCPPDRPAVGRVLAAEGTVTIDGRPARGPAAAVCAGQEILVAPTARAALRVDPADTVLRLDGGTRLVVEPPPGPDSGRVRLLDGLLYFLSQVRRRLDVETPYLTAGIEGTEVLLEVRRDRAELVVLDGRVRLAGSPAAARAEPLLTGEGVEVRADGTLERKGAAAAPGAPLRALARDRLSWTLWYPSVIEAEAARHPAIAEAAGLLARGRVVEAEARLAGLPPEGEIAGLAAALEAIVAVTRLEPEAAAAAARRAVALAPEAASPRLAWSYVRQARGAVEEALADAREAARLAPESALALARLAELSMMTGDLAAARREALASLQRADRALAHLVLGHVELAASRPARALERFDAALAREPDNPQAHLGRALALVRTGRLEEARAAFDTAAALDPSGASSRAYLARLLIEESRDEKAREQLAIAAALAPEDPTPRLFAALIEQRANRPAAALAELEAAIARNRGRAPFRSPLLLERDRASHGAALARIYQDMGREREAERAARDALARDPGNAAAHRFLADLFADRQRYQISRTSEQLQAQLSGPLEAEPVSPRLGYGDISIAPGAAALFPGWGEYGFAFERERIAAHATGVVGTSETTAGEALVGALYGRAALSAGWLASRTDGFRDDARIDNDLANLLARFQLDETLQLQLEGRLRETERGDIVQRFDPGVFGRNTDNRLRQSLGRLGAAWRPRPETLALGSLMLVDQREELGRLGAANPVQQSDGYLGELQLQERLGPARLVAGLGLTAIEIESENLPGLGDGQDERRARNAYLYATGEAAAGLRPTLGLAFSSYRNFRHDIDSLDPKLGLEWQPSDALALRAAAARTVKRPLLVDQTLEPTQVAGFTQLFDDLNGTEAWLYGVGADLRLGPDLRAGLQLTWRTLTVPTLVDGKPVFDDQDEIRLEGYLAWQALPELALSIEPTLERFDVASGDSPRYPGRADTLFLPLRLRWLAPSGLFGEARLSLVHQAVRDYLPADVEDGDSTFATLDAALGFRLPDGRGSIALVATNILDKDFKYLDDNYRTNEVRLGAFVPETTVLLRGTLRF
ncbi:MAG: TonB-dependent receptor [Geminicoccaceae bacterium]|nr:TonB-dependent receptor [Geminicoccaceae bacterium]MCX8101755.1 TonB-dependent receptor [Geminicoccaceae bacterium]